MQEEKKRKMDNFIALVNRVKESRISEQAIKK